MQQSVVRLCLVLFIVLLSHPAHSAVQLFSGRMEILKTSGKSCDGLAGKHDLTISITMDENGSAAYAGYFSGDGITIGRFSGNDPARLEVRYPFQDELRATGHSLSLSIHDASMTGELRDRHVADDVDDCNFDQAALELHRELKLNAVVHLNQLTGRFDAQLNRSQALAVLQKSGYAAALPYFEKALSLAETGFPEGSDQITPYVIGVATSYIWLERYDQFNQLYDTKIASIDDESVRTVFSGFRTRTLMTAGRAALARDEYDAALKNFEQAYKLQPQSSEAVIAVVSVYLRRESYQEAVTFLERAESVLTSEPDRKEIRSATAMLLARKAQRDDKNGDGPEAERALKRAMELDPGTAAYLIALARLRHKAGNAAEAESMLDNGLEQFKDASSQKDLLAAKNKILQTEMILKKIRKAGS